MPAALDVDREAVKTLAIAVGVREAARQMGLGESTVQQWSAREKWFAPTPLPPHLTKQPVTDVTKPSVALANMLESQSEKTKLGLSKAAMKASEHLGECSGIALTDKDTAQTAKAWASVGSTVHGWDAKQGQQINIMVNTALLGS